MGTDLTGQAATEFVRKHGNGALTILRERAETAEELGHLVAARTWREMADAAARLLPVGDGGADPQWLAPAAGVHHFGASRSSPGAAATRRR